MEKIWIVTILPPLRHWYCYCWSSRQYALCCKNKTSLSTAYEKEYNSTDLVICKTGKLPKWVFNKLMELVEHKECVSTWCENKAIKSHLFSEALLKQSFNSDYGLIPWINDRTGGFTYLRQPLSKITTMPIWCEYHDRELFKQIDKKEISGADNEIWFKLTMRAIGNEMRKKQNALAHIWWMVASRQAMERIHAERIYNDYLRHSELLERYKALEASDRNKDYNRVVSKSFEITTRHQIFVSTVVCPSINFDGELINDLTNWLSESAPLIINIISQGSWSTLYMSYLRKDGYKYRKMINDLWNWYEDDRKKFASAINNILHFFSENIVLDERFELPAWFELLPPDHNFEPTEVDYFQKPPIEFIC